MSGTKEAFLHNDPLIALLNILKDSPEDPGLSDMSTSILRSLDTLATRLAVTGSDAVPLSALPEAVLAAHYLTNISRLCHYDAVKYQPVVWIEKIWNSLNLKTRDFGWILEVCYGPISRAGSLSDIFKRAFYQATMNHFVVSHQPQFIGKDFKRPFLGPGAADLDAHVLGLTAENSDKKNLDYAWIIPILRYWKDQNCHPA